MSQFDQTKFVTGVHVGEPRGFRCTCGASCDFESDTCVGNVKTVACKKVSGKGDWMHACKAHAHLCKTEDVIWLGDFTDDDWEIPGPGKEIKVA
jgi:hypothetical protein